MSKIKDQDQLNSLFKGYDETKYLLNIYSIMIIKKLVNVNLFDPGRNIMVYIYQCIDLTLNSLYGALKKSFRIKERYYGNEAFNTEDSENDILDEESSSVSTKFDVPILVRYIVNDYINKYTTKLRIKKKVDEIGDYYFNNTLNITPINEFINSVFIFEPVRSGSGISYLKISEYSRIIAILQILMVDDPEYRDLLHLLSVSFSRTKTEKSNVDHSISLKRVGESYRHVKSNMEHLDSKINWSAPIDKIAEFLISNELYYNTAPMVWDMIGEPNKNNELMTTYKADVIERIYKIVATTLFNR
jgi:hypothetical protein